MEKRLLYKFSQNAVSFSDIARIIPYSTTHTTVFLPLMVEYGKPFKREGNIPLYKTQIQFLATLENLIEIGKSFCYKELHSIESLYPKNIEEQEKIANTRLYCLLESKKTNLVIDHGRTYLTVDENTSFHGNYGGNKCEIRIFENDSAIEPKDWTLPNWKMGDYNESDFNRKVKIVENSMKSHIKYMPELSPFQLHLSGNDDFALCRGFETHDEALREYGYLDALSKNGGISMEYDLSPYRGYYPCD